jgi:hypothetical protein
MAVSLEVGSGADAGACRHYVHGVCLAASSIDPTLPFSIHQTVKYPRTAAPANPEGPAARLKAARWLSLMNS